MATGGAESRLEWEGNGFTGLSLIARGRTLASHALDATPVDPSRMDPS